ncbi:MAG: 2-oxoacid:acceptor oxidoreductase family protein [Thermoprotei archaeon]
MRVEVRFHGRGGQGAVTAAELLAKAAIKEGKYAQGFAAFGPERRGAPVLAFTRISDEPIEIRSQIYEPDIVVVLDPSLVSSKSVLQGLKAGGVLVLNTSRRINEISQIFSGYKLAVVNATEIALKHIGSAITNTAMLGALVKATNIVKLESILDEVNARFGKSNVDTVIETYEKTEVFKWAQISQVGMK